MKIVTKEEREELRANNVANLNTVEYWVRESVREEYFIDYSISAYKYAKAYYEKVEEQGLLKGKGEDILYEVVSEQNYIDTVSRRINHVIDIYQSNTKAAIINLRHQLEHIDEVVRDIHLTLEEYTKEYLEIQKEIELIYGNLVRKLKVYRDDGINGDIREKINADLIKDIDNICEQTFFEMRDGYLAKLDEVMSPYGVADCNEQVQLRESRLQKIIDEDIYLFFEEDDEYTDGLMMKVPTSNGDVICLAYHGNFYVISQKGYDTFDIFTLERDGASYKTKVDINKATDEELLEELFYNDTKNMESPGAKFISDILMELGQAEYLSRALNFAYLIKGIYMAYDTDKKLKKRKFLNEFIAKKARKRDEKMVAEQRQAIINNTLGKIYGRN